MEGHSDVQVNRALLPYKQGSFAVPTSSEYCHHSVLDKQGLLPNTVQVSFDTDAYLVRAAERLSQTLPCTVVNN